MSWYFEEKRSGNSILSILLFSKVLYILAKYDELVFLSGQVCFHNANYASATCTTCFCQKKCLKFVLVFLFHLSISVISKWLDLEQTNKILKCFKDVYPFYKFYKGKSFFMWHTTCSLSSQTTAICQAGWNGSQNRS